MAADKVGELTAEAENRMNTAIEVLRRDLAGIRTGRASPALVERLSVDYYGTPTPLNQLANIAAPESQLLVVHPWDKNAIGPIEKAILKSDLGLTPANDGRVVRLSIPRLTEERRKELIKVVHRRAEEGKVAIRNCRRDAVEHLHRLEKDQHISEDEVKRVQERVQKFTDRHIEDVDRLVVVKEKEISEV